MMPKGDYAHGTPLSSNTPTYFVALGFIIGNRQYTVHCVRNVGTANAKY